MSILIKDTTREERKKIVQESLGGAAGGCDEAMAGMEDMYDDYIEGKKELKEINMEYRARFVVGGDGPDRSSCNFY